MLRMSIDGAVIVVRIDNVGIVMITIIVYIILFDFGNLPAICIDCRFFMGNRKLIGLFLLFRLIL